LEGSDSESLAILLSTFWQLLAPPFTLKNVLPFDAGHQENDFFSVPQKNFDFCICIQLNLCYRVFIPLVEAVNSAPPSRK
jgi:hypothetical protein